jgi:hypothetical protein
MAQGPVDQIRDLLDDIELLMNDMIPQELREQAARLEESGGTEAVMTREAAWYETPLSIYIKALILRSDSSRIHTPSKDSGAESSSVAFSNRSHSAQMFSLCPVPGVDL